MWNYKWYEWSKFGELNEIRYGKNKNEILGLLLINRRVYNRFFYCGFYMFLFYIIGFFYFFLYMFLVINCFILFFLINLNCLINGYFFYGNVFVFFNMVVFRYMWFGYLKWV